MAFGVAADTDRLDARPLEGTGRDQRRGVEERPLRLGRVACDDEAAPHPGFAPHRRKEAFKFIVRDHPPGGEMRPPPNPQLTPRPPPPTPAPHLPPPHDLNPQPPYARTHPH